MRRAPARPMPEAPAVTSVPAPRTDAPRGPVRRAVDALFNRSRPAGPAAPPAVAPVPAATTGSTAPSAASATAAPRPAPVPIAAVRLRPVAVGASRQAAGARATGPAGSSAGAAPGSRSSFASMASSPRGSGPVLSRAVRDQPPASTLPVPPQMARPLARAAAASAGGAAQAATPMPAFSPAGLGTPAFTAHGTSGTASRMLARTRAGDGLGASGPSAAGSGGGGGGGAGGGGGSAGGSDDQFHDAVLRLLRDEQEQVGQLFPEIF